MNLDRIKRVNELAELLWDEPEATWEGILRERCAGKPDLIAEVMAFARGCQNEDGNSLRPVVSVDAEMILKDPETIGPYKIVRRLDKGGMGVVYEALRPGEEIEKRVAIKIIKPGFDSEEILRRFKKERFILSRLGHLCIVQILDASAMPDGRPYLVMEYVEGGVPIDEYCKRNKLGVNERLALFQKVCAVVEFAHQRQVVHRDLKPGNILVTPDGEPKLLDFGLAGLLETKGTEPSFVQSAVGLVRTGTWEYMSPEQARGEAPLTVSDIYSLGVVLYEVLAGTLPYRFENESYAEITGIICEKKFPPPSRVSQEGSALHEAKLSALQLRDLDEIVEVALSKSPEDRYPTVSALGDSIQAYLDGRPIPSRRADWRYRTRKFIRRNWRPVVAGVLAVALVGFGLGYFWKKTQQEALAKESKKFSERYQNEAIKSGAIDLIGMILSGLNNGITEEKLDLATVEKTLQQRAEKGDTNSQVVLGLGYLMVVEVMKQMKEPEVDPLGFTRKMRIEISSRISTEQGVAYLERASARNGVAAAMLASAYREGIGGVRQDPWEAFKWAKKSAAAGSALGGSLLGLMYWMGSGTEKNRAEGMRWLKLSAEAGDIIGQTFVCQCYANGEVLPKDILLAHVWCNLAATNQQFGFTKEMTETRERAAKARDEFEKILTPAQLRRAEQMASAWRKKTTGEGR